MEAAKIEVLGALKQRVRPEFINRIDDIVMFTPLNKRSIYRWWNCSERVTKKCYHNRGIMVDTTDEVLSTRSFRLITIWGTT
jgi:ATP-dependent Clp protease ATP-binding subunit ClpB